VTNLTSQPDYWQQVSDFVGDAPSTLHMILPEVWLNSPDVDMRIRRTQEAMQQYLSKGFLAGQPGMILVEREASGKTRTGLMLALDLEAYDYHRGSQTLIRATEGTILERLPPRMHVRRGHRWSCHTSWYSTMTLIFQSSRQSLNQKLTYPFAMILI
jgi:hypothetical protein